MNFQTDNASLKIIKNKKLKYELPFLWIRDNCSCNDCRIQETKEKSGISISYFKKIVVPTPDELKRHKDYLKNNLKKNFFN